MSHYFLSTGATFEEALRRFKSIKTKTQRAWLSRVYEKVTIRRRAKNLAEEIPSLLAGTKAYPERTLADSTKDWIENILRSRNPYPDIENTGSKLRRAKGWKKRNIVETIISDSGCTHNGVAHSKEVCLSKAMSVMSEGVMDDFIKSAKSNNVFTYQVPAKAKSVSNSSGGRAPTHVQHVIKFLDPCFKCGSPSTCLDNYFGYDYSLCYRHVRPRTRSAESNCRRWWKRKVTRVLGSFPPCWATSDFYKCSDRSERVSLFLFHNENLSSDTRFKSIIWAKPYGDLIPGSIKCPDLLIGVSGSKLRYFPSYTIAIPKGITFSVSKLGLVTTLGFG